MKMIVETSIKQTSGYIRYFLQELHVLAMVIDRFDCIIKLCKNQFLKANFILTVRAI